MPDPDITALLLRWHAGDRNAFEELTPLVYEELRRVASRMLRHERAGHTLQSTALVHEAYLRLVNQPDVPWETRAHFFAVASQMIRRILVDHARKRRRLKRGGADEPFVLEESFDIPEPKGRDLLRLDDALKGLERLDARQCQVVEMKFFGGMENAEIAEALGISLVTVKRDWATARAWLLRELDG